MNHPYKLTILPANEKDTDRLTGIIRAGFADVAVRFGLTPQNCPKHPSNCTREWIERDLARGVHYFILTADGEDAGCVGVEQASADTCYMERLAVLPKFRNSGCGARLARHAIERAKVLGAANVGIGIIAADAGLQAFYEALGFQAGEVKTFDHLPFEVAFMRVSV